MSRITNTNIQPGTALAAEANSKFSDVVGATTLLNGENVRSEGIDRRQVDYSPCKYSDMLSNDVTTPTTYTMDGSAAFELTHGTGFKLSTGLLPIVLKDGDILRLHHSVLFETQDTNLAAWGGLPGVTARVVTFPMWDLTSNALANFVPLTSHLRLDIPCVSGVMTPYYITPAHANYKTTGYGVMVTQGPLIGQDYRLYQRAHGCWNYIHSGADLSIYGFNLYARAPLIYWEEAVVGDGTRALYHIPPVVAVDFEIGRGSLGYMVLRDGTL